MDLFDELIPQNIVSIAVALAQSILYLIFYVKWQVFSLLAAMSF